MVKLIVRVVLVLLVCGWIGGTWYTGQSLEKRLRTMMRDDPSNIVEVVFDPFAEPEVEPLLYDRVWFSLVDYRRNFLASIARLHLNLRLAPGEQPVSIPLLAKFHHGPLILPGGLAVGAARMQITLDDNPSRRNIPPRWGKPAKPIEGMAVMRGVVGLDGGFSGRSWLQEIELNSHPIKFELQRMQIALSANAALSQVLVDGDMADLLVTYVDDKLKVTKADVSLRANNVLEKERYDGVMNVNWVDAELHYKGVAKRVATMEIDSEYRLVNSKIDAEVSINAEAVSTAEEKEENREVVFDYGEGVAAVGELPIERVIDLWDHYRIWEPPTAALVETGAEDRGQWRKAEHLMSQVSSNVSAYSSFKLGLDDQEILVRANVEFIGEDQIDRMEQVGTAGELLKHLLGDLTYHADGPLAELPEVKSMLNMAQELGMVEVDEVGASGNLHVRAGEVRINGIAMTPKEFLRDKYAMPLWEAKQSTDETLQ